MIKWFKRNQTDKSANVVSETLNNATVIETVITTELPEKQSLFNRFRRGLTKTRQQFGDGISRLLLGKKELNDELMHSLETILLTSDLGIETTKTVLDSLTDGLARKALSDGDTVFLALRQKLESILTACDKPLLIENNVKPFVILMVGINGAGKTTTIGKLARQYQSMGKKVMLAAGDTFRAAAVEQLQAWGECNQIPVIAQQTGADSASVIFDAFQAAKARGIDVLIADTAGRLHTQGNLMEELKKIKRVIQKIDPTAPHETMLVLDASIGQNALNQARQFNELIGLSGITMTKLDGTAKGGILFAIASELGIPFRYLGIGESIDDLRDFSAKYFVDAIFNDD